MATKTCFVIAPIGEPESESRRRSDQVLRYVIAPVVEPLGYMPIRADAISEPGLITSQIIEHLVTDDLVVADLSEHNPNVFYELAVRHAVRKPLVQVIETGQRIPFDVAGMRTINLNHRDLECVDSAKSEMGRQIEQLEKSPSRTATPISVAVDLQALRDSSDPAERSTEQVLSLLYRISGDMTNVRAMISNPDSILPPEYIEAVSRRSSENALPTPLLQDILKSVEFILSSESEIVAESQFREMKVLLKRLQSLLVAVLERW